MSRIVSLSTLFSLVAILTLNAMQVDRARSQYAAVSPLPSSIAISTLTSHDPAPTPTPNAAPLPDTPGQGDYRIIGVRYWLHPDRARVVFDLEPASEILEQPPAYQLEELDKELFISFPFGGAATVLEPGDQVVGRVALTGAPSSGAVARIELNRPVVVRSFHLVSPQRLVFDLHPQPIPSDPQPRASPPAQEKPLTGSAAWQRLEQELRNLVARSESSAGNRIGLAVTDLQTGETISINGSERFIPGCAIKLFVWLSVLADVQQAKYSLDTSVGADSCWYVGGGEWWCGYNRKTIGQYVWDALSVSCNTANSILTRQTGIETVNDRMHEWGMKNSIYSHWYDLGWFKGNRTAYLVYSEAEAENYLVPDEAAGTLARLYRGEIFPAEVTELALERLTHSSSYLGHNNVIPAKLPPTAVVSHKYGFIPPSFFADIGIVRTKDFAFAMTFFSSGTSTYSAYYDMHTLGADLARMVFDHLDDKY